MNINVCSAIISMQVFMFIYIYIERESIEIGTYPGEKLPIYVLP